MCTHGGSVLGDARGKNGYEGEPLAAREGESTPVAGEGEGRAWRSPRRRLAARWPVGPAGCSAAGSGAAGARPRGATGAVEPPGRRREARRGPHSCESGSPTPSRHCSHDLRCERAAPIVFGRAPRPSRLGLGCDSTCAGVAAGCTCCAVVVVGTAAAVVVTPPAGHRQKSAARNLVCNRLGRGAGGGDMQAEACCAPGGERCREPLLLLKLLVMTDTQVCAVRGATSDITDTAPMTAPLSVFTRHDSLYPLYVCGSVRRRLATPRRCRTGRPVAARRRRRSAP